MTLPLKKSNKKRKRIVSLVCILLFGFLFGLPAYNILAWQLSGSTAYQAVTVISHRGAAGLAPENTLPAFDSGIVHRAGFVETDVRQTADDQLVLMHDKTINRTTDGSGAIHKLTYEQLQKVNASASFSGYNNRTGIPLLAEVLTTVKKSGSKLLLEIKDHELYPGMVGRIAAAIKAAGMENQVEVFSFDEEPIREINALLPQVKTGLFSLGYRSPGSNTKVNYICPHWLTVLYFPAVVKNMHNKGYKIFVWTVDHPFWMRYLLSKQVDGIISDRPDVLQATLKR